MQLVELAGEIRRMYKPNPTNLLIMSEMAIPNQKVEPNTKLPS